MLWSSYNVFKTINYYCKELAFASKSWPNNDGWNPTILLGRSFSVMDNNRC